MTHVEVIRAVNKAALGNDRRSNFLWNRNEVLLVGLSYAGIYGRAAWLAWNKSSRSLSVRGLYRFPRNRWEARLPRPAAGPTHADFVRAVNRTATAANKRYVTIGFGLSGMYNYLSFRDRQRSSLSGMGHRRRINWLHKRLDYLQRPR